MSGTSTAAEESKVMDDTPEQTARRVIHSLGLKSGQSILLCLFWMTKKQYRYFCLFPTVLFFDVTFGTNNERRPLARGCLLTPDGRIVPIFNIFLPSQSEWVFHWIFNKVLPDVLPPEILAKIHVVMTDQDRHCYEQVVAAARNGLLPNALHKLCAWHKVDRHFVNTGRALVRPSSKYDEKFLSTCTRWLYSFTNTIETKEEEDYHRSAFKIWLDSQTKVAKPLLQHARNYFTDKFEPYLHKLSFRHFKATPGGTMTVNSYAESDNSSLARDPMGPNAFMGIDRSMDAIANHCDRRISSLEGKAFHRLTSSYYYEPVDDEVWGYTEEQMSGAKKNLTDKLILKSADMMFAQWIEGKNCYGFSIFGRKTDEFVITVRRFYDPQQLAESDDPIPRYARTRKVTIKKENNSYVLRCSCGFFERTGGIPCRHMYCCWETEPKPSHCSIRHHQSYEAFYQHESHKDYTALCDSLLEQEPSGPAILTHSLQEDLCLAQLLPLDQALLYDDEESRQWMLEATRGIVVLNDTLCTKEKLQELRDKEDGWEKHGFGFHREEMGVDVTAEDYMPGPTTVIKNGYRAFTKLPTVSTMCNLITNGEDLMVVNECVKTAISLLLARHSRTMNHSSAALVSGPVVENSSGYKRQKPPGSPSRTKSRAKKNQHC
jgi:hypothetical protein